MAFLPTLEEVQAVAQDDAFIQAVVITDPIWLVIIAMVEKRVKEFPFGELQKEAQIYLTAHGLSMANQPVGGRGPLSSESIGGITESFTLPWLNQTLVEGGTQFGLTYLSLVNATTIPFQVIKV